MGGKFIEFISGQFCVCNTLEIVLFSEFSEGVNGRENGPGVRARITG